MVSAAIPQAEPSKACRIDGHEEGKPMKKLTIVLTAGLLLSACSDGGNNQSQPIDNTPTGGAAAPAQTDADPTPQTGSGGQSPVESPTGTEKR
jgi:hypothetical protein